MKILGNGLATSDLGLGCMLARTSGAVARRRSRSTITRALDLGIAMLDTADVYGKKTGKNEELLAGVIARRRDQVVLSTKFGLRLDDAGMVRVDNSAEWATRACTDSLRRLRTDYIDIYYLHRHDPAVPIEDTITVLADLVRRGYVRHIGLSAVSAATLRAAHAVHPITAVQESYSLVNRAIEDELLGTCRELGVGVVAYHPLSRGVLASGLETAGRSVAATIRAVADAVPCTPAQLSIAWLMSRGPDIVPLPGTTDRHHLEENVGAIEVTLSEECLARLDALDARTSVAESHDA
ncbi:aldo/keto reductase [Nocardia sp. NPDC051911]|uniref:aldo/keto reductase n=1 Tax=Nocardia sp. NPDC051911 TaxID=3154648 RepID=UPI0034324EF5